MRKIVAAMTLALALSLSACGTSEGAQSIEDCMLDGNAAAGCEVTIMYKDKPLNCVTWDGSHGETGLTCDFVEYHDGVQNSVTP